MFFFIAPKLNPKRTGKNVKPTGGNSKIKNKYQIAKSQKKFYKIKTKQYFPKSNKRSKKSNSNNNNNSKLRKSKSKSNNNNNNNNNSNNSKFKSKSNNNSNNSKSKSKPKSQENSNTNNLTNNLTNNSTNSNNKSSKKELSAESIESDPSLPDTPPRKFLEMNDIKKYNDITSFRKEFGSNSNNSNNSNISSNSSNSSNIPSITLPKAQSPINKLLENIDNIKFPTDKLESNLPPINPTLPPTNPKLPPLISTSTQSIITPIISPPINHFPLSHHTPTRRPRSTRSRRGIQHNSSKPTPKSSPKPTNTAERRQSAVETLQKRLKLSMLYLYIFCTKLI